MTKCSRPGCEAGLKKPQIREAVVGITRCYAGHVNVVDAKQAVIDILEDYESRISALEREHVRFGPRE